jgi:hypothetical protein
MTNPDIIPEEVEQLFDLVTDKMIADRIIENNLRNLTNNYPGILGARNHKDQTVLCSACRHGKLTTVKLLLENYNGNPYRLGEHDFNCMFHAALGRQHTILRYLFRNYPDLLTDQDGFPVLCAASRWGDLSTVKLIIEEFGINVLELGPYKTNCLQAAVFGNQEETVRFLCKYYPELLNWKSGLKFEIGRKDYFTYTENREEGVTALGMACGFHSPTMVKTILTAVPKDFKLKDLSKFHKCVLSAAYGSNKQVLEYLHENHADLFNATDQHGRNILETVKEENLEAMYEFITQLDAKNVIPDKAVVLLTKGIKASRITYV